MPPKVLQAVHAIRTEYKWRALAVSSIYLWGGAIEISAWPVILPSIAHHFDVAPSQVAWLAVSFALGMAGSVLTLGHLGDLVGHKRLVIIGLILDATLLASVASMPTLAPMFILRFFQGMAHAMVLSNIQAIGQSQFTREERGRALGFSGMAGPIGVMMGPLYGGIAADLFGWRAALYGGALIIVSLLVVVIFSVRNDRPPEVGLLKTLRELDWPGAAVLLASIVMLIVSARLIGKAATREFGALLLPVAALSFFLVVVLERRAAHPILNLALFTRRTFAIATAGLIFFSTIAGSNAFLFPFYLQQGLGWTSAAAGSTLVFGTLLTPFINPVSGILTDRVGPRRVQAVGIGAAVLGLFLSSQLGGDPARGQIILALMVIGVGGSIFNPPNNRIIYNSAPQGAMGTAAAITASGRYIGQSMGAAIAAAMLAAQADQGVTVAFGNAMMTMTIVLAAGMAFLLAGPSIIDVLRRSPRTREEAESV